LEIQRSQYIRSKVTVHKCAETIQGRKLFKGGNYMRKYGILKFHETLQRYLLAYQANSALRGKVFLHLAPATLKGLVELKKDKHSRPLFTITFKPKMVISKVKGLVHLLNEL
jgi:hypothetical protein